MPGSMWSAMKAHCASAAVYTSPLGISSVCSRYLVRVGVRVRVSVRVRLGSASGLG